MSTLDLLDDSFPHGTPDGYRLGCRTAACPALIPCRTVHTRYAGDYTFAKLIDGGMALSEILEHDAAAREGIRQRDKIAAREDRRVAAQLPPARKPKPARQPAGTPKPAHTPKVAPPAPAVPVPTPAAPRRQHPGYDWIARARQRITRLPADDRVQYAREVDRYQAELDLHVDELGRWNKTRRTLRVQLTEAAATLKTATIAAGTGLSVGGVIEDALRRATGQHQAAAAACDAADQQRPAEPAKPHLPRTSPKAPRAHRPRQLQPHGTNACRAHGCDRPECIEAARVYHREWMERRKEQQIPLEHHGSAYGYQLGCKDRHKCPAEVSCADASLAEERRRRREAGIPEQAPRIPAEPVRQHVRQLMAAGMTVLGIAEQAEVSKTGVKILLYGRSGARKGELPREVEAEKAKRILALQPTADRYALLA